MSRFIACAVIGALFVPPASFAEDQPAKPQLTHLDIQSQAKQKLDQTFPPFFNNNSLAELPQGVKELGGVKFKIDKKCITLGGKTYAMGPHKVEIKLGRKFKTFSLLHGTQFGGYNEKSNEFFVEDGTLIGQYEFHYADGGTEFLPIVYGEDVRDWWNWDKSKKIKRGKVAWTGSNPDAKQQGVKLRLYLSQWKNPKPDQVIERIVITSMEDTVSAPFCVAITLDETQSSP